MRILFIGDIVGQPGRKIVCQALGGLVRREEVDLVVANAENASAGDGLTIPNLRELQAAGVQCVTMGDHIYGRRELQEVLNRETNIVKPANYPPEAAGRDHAIVTLPCGTQAAVISLMGRVFMKPVDCPFRAADRVLAQLPPEVKVILVDFHAEATSDKQLMGRHLDGRVTAVLGTHTHVATADEQILPGGTAFQCDVGMTGPYESIIGREVARVLEAILTFNPVKFDVAERDARLCGALVDCDVATGRATAIRRVEIREAEAAELAGLAKGG